MGGDPCLGMASAEYKTSVASLMSRLWIRNQVRRKSRKRRKRRRKRKAKVRRAQQAQTLTFLWACRKALLTRSRGPLRWMMTPHQRRTRKHPCRHNRFEQSLGTTEYQL